METQNEFSDEINALVQSSYDHYITAMGSAEHVIRRMVLSVLWSLQDQGWTLIPPGSETEFTG